MRGAPLLFVAFIYLVAGQDIIGDEDEWGLVNDDVWNDWNESTSVLFVGNATGNSSIVTLSNITEIDPAMQDDINSLGSRLIDLISGMVGGRGGGGDDSWTFVSFITLAPLPCSSVREVVSLFDQAMAAANPDAGIVSTPRRLGGLSCNSEGSCPCSDAGNRRRYVTRVMELSSRSQLKSVAYPLEEDFPYHVVIQPLPVF